MKNDKKSHSPISRIVLCSAIGLMLYFVLSLFLGIQPALTASSKGQALLLMLGHLWWLKLFIIAFCILGYLALHGKPKLAIRDDVAGSGQHGDAHFASDTEVMRAFKPVSFGRECVPGFLVGLEKEKWVIDDSDAHMMLLAGTGAGKTTTVFIPTLEYNFRVNQNTGGRGASMLALDVKGTLYEATAAEAQAKGYRTPVINLRDVFRSYPINILYSVNREIDAWRRSESEDQKAKHYGAAERYAKTLSDAIVNLVPRNGGGDNQFFIDTAQNMITGFILLVSLYAPPEARHIISVFGLIIELSSNDESLLPIGMQKTKLATLMEHIQDDRIRNYVASATCADQRTSLNIFSSALADLLKFVDAEMEQLLTGYSEELSAEKFINQPTIVYVICPDENPTRHFLASLFIRLFSNELIEFAEQPSNGGVLPRQVLYLADEFGNYPPIRDIEALFSALRSRRARLLISLQGDSQLRTKYDEQRAITIESNCMIFMFSALAPSASQTAKRISEILGNETIMTGSKSISKGVTTTNTSLAGRPLLTPSQLVRLPWGQFIVQKTGYAPYIAHMRPYKDYLKLEAEQQVPPPSLRYSSVLSASAAMIEAVAKGHLYHLRKGMFDSEDSDW